MAAVSTRRTYFRKRFCLSFIGNSPKFFNSRDLAVKNAFACLYPPHLRVRYIGTAWDGLFISSSAFGDASYKINQNRLHAFFFTTL